MQLPVDASVVAISSGQWKKFQRDLLDRLETFHADNPDLLGIGIERLRTQLELRMPVPAFRAALQSLARGGEIALDGAWVRLSGHEVTMAPADERLWNAIEPLLGGAERFRPPRVRDIAALFAVPEPQVRRLLKLGSRIGKVHEVAHDHFFLRGTVAEMVAIIVEISTASDEGWFTAAQFRDRVENGRKVAIQILDFFDHHSITLRCGDLRRVNRNRLDLFAGPTDGATGEDTVSGGESSPVGRPDFKSGRGRETVFGGFDSHSLPPSPGHSGSSR